MLLLIDNYDSFAHNLARYLVRLGCEPRVVRNDALTMDDIRRWQPEAIVLSPGPCTPQKAGCSLDVVRHFHQQTPILGVCLGHQSIVVALGGLIDRSEPMHGRTSLVLHNQQGVFAGVPTPFQACRYHSLSAQRDSLPAALEVTGRTEEGTIMAVRHRDYPVIGLQFHPEAVLTEHGFTLLANFLTLANVSRRPTPPSMESELRTEPPTRPDVPRSPITF